MRRYAGPNDRVADNPLYLDDITGYPVNLSWAFLLQSSILLFGVGDGARLCGFAGDRGSRRWTISSSACLRARPPPDDLRQMAQDYGCKVVVVTDSDGALDPGPLRHKSLLPVGGEDRRVENLSRGAGGR